MSVGQEINDSGAEGEIKVLLKGRSLVFGTVTYIVGQYKFKWANPGATWQNHI